MNRKLRLRVRRRLRARRGQAMMSYAMFTFLILIGLTGTATYFIPRMMDAIDQFTASMYFAINMPFP